MRKRIIGYAEALERLRNGQIISWIGGRDFRSYFSLSETVRYDTLCKLRKDGYITDWGYPELHGYIKYKEPQ